MLQNVFSFKNALENKIKYGRHTGQCQSDRLHFDLHFCMFPIGNENLCHITNSKYCLLPCPTFPLATLVVAMSSTNWSPSAPGAASEMGLVPSVPCLARVGTRLGDVLVKAIPYKNEAKEIVLNKW